MLRPQIERRCGFAAATAVALLLGGLDGLARAQGDRYPLQQLARDYDLASVRRLPPLDGPPAASEWSHLHSMPGSVAPPRLAWRQDEASQAALAPVAATAAAPVEDRPLGDAPVDNSEVFLRQSTVLLEPGEGQWDIGVTYLWQETLLPVELVGADLAHEQVRSRELAIPLNVRYGIREGTEIFGQLPVGYAMLERSNPDFDEVTSRAGTGDLTVGLKSLWRKESDDGPDVILIGSATAPIGTHPYHAGDAAALGGGFWSVFGGVNLVKSYDPVVVFGGVGYAHYFEEGFAIGSIQPGEQFDYSFGMGMAVNEDIVISAEFIGALQTYTYVNDVRIPNSLLEPMSLRLGLTQVLERNRYVEPFVIFGLTSDAPTVQIGVLWTGGFGCQPDSPSHEDEHDAKD